MLGTVVFLMVYTMIKWSAIPMYTTREVTSAVVGLLGDRIGPPNFKYLITHTLTNTNLTPM